MAVIQGAIEIPQHKGNAERGEKKKESIFHMFFFQRLGKKPGVIFLQLGMCVC